MEDKDRIEFLKELLEEAKRNQLIQGITLSMFLRDRQLEGEFSEFMNEKTIDFGGKV